MSEGKKPGEGGTWEEGDDASRTEEARGQMGTERRLWPSPSISPPSPPPRLKVKNRSCGKRKTE